MICTLAPRPSARRGFTLPEMLMVLVIMGIMAAMAGPRLSRWIQTISQRSVANQLVADLSRARALAAREGSSVSLRLASATTYRLTIDDQAGDEVREIKEVDVSQMNRATTFVSEVGSRIAFDSRGIYRTDRSTTFALVVKRGSVTETIRVSQVGRPSRDR